MHGLIFRAVQTYLTETHGEDQWFRIARDSGTGIMNFEAMLHYSADQLDALLKAASQRLSRTQETILEDMGTFFVSRRQEYGLRRLLRFGGSNFPEFLRTIDDFPDWARLAVNGLELPRMQLQEISADKMVIYVQGEPKGFVFALIGALRAMADDYGDLVIIELQSQNKDVARISLHLALPSFNEPREFELSLGKDPA